MNNNIVKDVIELKENNDYLIERLKSTQESLRRVYAREALYQSTLQNLKNDLRKFYERIDTSPHSSNSEYAEDFYTYSSISKKIIKEIEDYCNQENLKYNTTACEILTIINKAKDGDNAR